MRNVFTLTKRGTAKMLARLREPIQKRRVSIKAIDVLTQWHHHLKEIVKKYKIHKKAYKELLKKSYRLQEGMLQAERDRIKGRGDSDGK